MIRIKAFPHRASIKKMKGTAINMQIVLIGEADSRRTEFFMKAAAELAISVKFIPYPSIDKLSDFNFAVLENSVVKIDPPLPHSSNINDISTVSLHYSHFLNKVQSINNTKFLNSPDQILRVMDKQALKHTVENAGIRTAQSFPGINSISDLRENKQLNSVFIKPRFGSGAAGVVAYRRNLKTGDEIIYTTVRYSNMQFYNNSKLRTVRDKYELETIVNYILQIGALVETWIPKASHAGKTYDLRIVWQFDKIEYAVARLSSGTITNLHLGGRSVDMAELGLSRETLHEIEVLCGNTMAQFPGLNSAGLDILLEKGSLKPYIIEVNGQGDLLHKDIRGENRLYKSQICRMLKTVTDDEPNLRTHLRRFGDRGGYCFRTSATYLNGGIK